MEEVLEDIEILIILKLQVDIGNEGNELVREHYQTYYSEQLTNAMNDVWQ